ncbi:hypothetical protein ILUMI_08153 [Ignelater luminosus]|uniref:Cytochrome P450 n=1 Tax=Ignelater luminosus TaxID=2038154 RepID=A0A8K0D6M4_IGNLU|nr:hypothetical protein ILUMI_08153 [Ignelater luminosus]
MFWFLISGVLVILVYYVFVNPFNYWERKGVPQDRIWKIWLETVLVIIQYRPFHETLKRAYDNFPEMRYGGVYQLFTPMLLIRDPELIKQITVKDFEHFIDHFHFFPTNDEPLWEKNLFLLKGEKWREMRTTLSPSFTSSKMKLMFGLINDCAKQFVKYYEEQNENVIQLEMKDTFTRYANDVIATSAFGVTCDSIRNRDNEFYLNGKIAADFGEGIKGMLKFVIATLSPKLANKLGLKLTKRESSMFFTNVIKSNIKSREQNGIIRPDMIHLLLEARKGKLKYEELESIPKEKLTDEDIAAQAFIFFLAGFDSVATLMYFVAYELAVHPDIQVKLQLEIDNILNNSNGSLTYENLSSMKYMDMVLSETLRKWPNAFFLDRVCVKPYTIPPVREGEKPVYLEKGDTIQIPLFGIHYDPEYFPEPERFDPERFSDENKSKINPYVYLPFGSGPRICIGSRFALMETKMVFSYLLAKFDIVVTEKTPIPLKLSRSKLSLDNDEGFWMGLQLRKESTETL